LETDPDPRRLRTTGAGVVAGWALAGLVAGRLVRPVLTELDRTAPPVGWVQAAVLYLVAAILGGVAWATHRSLQVRRERLEPHQAVNRLVLAKACALVGALVAGGYLGYALSWVGAPAELSDERIVLSLVAAGGAVLTVVGSLLLERACRVSGDEEES
jgi:Protein of unknown function (DUF3180)